MTLRPRHLVLPVTVAVISVPVALAGAPLSGATLAALLIIATAAALAARVAHVQKGARDA